MFETNFLSILAESSLGSMTSTAHPIDSSAFKLSNNSSLFSSFSVLESTAMEQKYMHKNLKKTINSQDPIERISIPQYQRICIPQH